MMQASSQAAPDHEPAGPLAGVFIGRLSLRDALAFFERAHVTVLAGLMHPLPFQPVAGAGS